MVEEMDQVRNFTQTNRSSIVNIIYIVAAFVLIYYVVMYYFLGEERDKILLKNKMSTYKAREQNALVISREGETSFRIGQEFTLSFWIYITNYNFNASGGNTGGQIQSILAMFDGKSLESTTDIESLLFVGLHPLRPQMIVRAGNMGSTTRDELVTYQKVAGPTPSYSWLGSGPNATIESSLTACDIMDIDTQRWLNIVVSVNNRIMDVYMDGKLARSCILPNAIKTSDKEQILKLFPTTNFFNGYISGVQVSNYAVTPDVIYGRYQAGPYFSSGFLDYLVDKFGIRVTYTGDTASGNVSLWSVLGINPN